MLTKMHAPTLSGPELDRPGMGTAGITPDDRLAVAVDDLAIVISLTPPQMRKLATALTRAAMRLELKEGGR